MPWSVLQNATDNREHKYAVTRSVMIKGWLLLHQQVVLYLQEEIERFFIFAAGQVLRGRQVHGVQPSLHNKQPM